MSNIEPEYMLRYTKEGERVFDVISKLYTLEPDLSMLEAESSYIGEVRTYTSFILKCKSSCLSVRAYYKRTGLNNR